MTIYVAVWAAMALVVVSLAIWRQLMGIHEDDTVHIADAKLSQDQASMARRIGTVDRWGKALTAVAFLYGLALAAVYLYNVWVETGTRLPS